MRVYTTKLNKYKRLDNLSSNIVASTNENEVSFIRIYLDEWLDELEDFDKYIEIQRPDGEKYISKILQVQIDNKGVYIELPITSQLCYLNGIYLFDFCAIQETEDKKYVFKSLNLCPYEINDSINALVGMSDEDVNLLTDFVDSYCDKYVDDHFYSQEALTNMFANKVDKVEGKCLSTNDFTNELKTKLDNISVSTILLEDGTYNFTIIGGNN